MPPSLACYLPPSSRRLVLTACTDGLYTRRPLLVQDANAADYVQLGFDRAAAIRDAEKLMHGFDAMVYPTCGTHARARSEEVV